MPNKVGERYQITIDKLVRERLGVQPGDLAVERVEDGLLVVEFMPRRHDRSLRGILRRAPVLPGSTNSTAEKEAAWTARGGELSESATTKSPRRPARLTD